MPDSRPPIFDDGGGLPDVERVRFDEASGVDYYNDRHPNFLIRRALAVGAAVVVVALAAVGVGKLIGGGGDGSASSLDGADWNTVVAIDSSSGTIVLTDDKGEETGRFRLGIQPLTDARVVGSTVVASSGGAIAIVSLNDTEVITTIDIETSGDLLMPSGSAQTVIAHDASLQRAIFVHGPTGEVIDTDTLDTVAGARYELELTRSDPTGRNLLVTDTGNFQSVLFSFDRDQPSFFPGLALAVNAENVVTAQNVGNDATVAVFDHAGEPGPSARTASVRAGMLVNGGVVLVTVDGEVMTMSLTTGETSGATSMAVGTVESGHVATRGDRLVVVGTLGTGVISADAQVLAELADARPTATGIDLLAPRRTLCLIAERSIDGEIVVVDLDTGAIIAEALANPDVLAGVDGCTPVVPTSSGYLVITADGVLRATIAGDVVAVSPDGRTLVVDDTNRFELLPIVEKDNESTTAEPIDIGRSGRDVFFADL